MKIWAIVLGLALAAWACYFFYLAMQAPDPNFHMPKLGRNSPCHCGSGKKYKDCCLSKDSETQRAAEEQKIHDEIAFDRIDPQIWSPFIATRGAIMWAKLQSLMRKQK